MLSDLNQVSSSRESSNTWEYVMSVMSVVNVVSVECGGCDVCKTLTFTWTCTYVIFLSVVYNIIRLYYNVSVCTLNIEVPISIDPTLKFQHVLSSLLVDDK